MPFQSEKQRRYMHANLPELAQRWERDYAGGGLARLPQALTTDDTVGEQIKEMMNTKTAFRPNTLLDNRIKTMQGMEDQGYTQPNLQKLKQKDWNQHIDEKTPLSLPKDQYKGIEGYTAELPIGASNYMNDATWSGLDNKFSDLGTTISDAFITPAGSETETEGLASLDITGKPNYGFEEMDKWGINRMNLEKEDEVVSRSFKDHDNLKSWLDANPNMGENIKRKAIDFYEGATDVGRYGIDKAQAFKKMLLSGAGAAMKLPLGMMNFRNPLDPNSRNYNPRLRGQIDYLGGALGTRSSPYQFRSGKGSSVLGGKNLVSMFGTNDYGQMLQKRIDYFNKFKEKRGLTIAQNKKLQDTIREKAAADKQRMEAQLAAYSGPVTHSYDPKQGGGGRPDRPGGFTDPGKGSYGPWS